MLRVTRADDDHIAAVARLAAEAHARARVAEPLLGRAYADPAASLPVLRAAADRWVAVRDGTVVAGLFATTGPYGAWGVPVGVVGDSVALADVYAVAAAEWIAAGQHKHALSVRSSEPALANALIDLGFGRQQAFALRPVADVPEPPRPPGLMIRAGGPDDLADVLTLAPLIADQHAGSPVFAPRTAGFYDELAASHRQELAGEADYLLAYLDGRIAGMAMTYPAEESPFAPPGAVELAVAMVSPAARGRGVGLALVAEVLREAARRKASAVVTDWRTANLLSSRFFPGRGFRVVAHRYARTIDVTPVE